MTKYHHILTCIGDITMLKGLVKFTGNLQLSLLDTKTKHINQNSDRVFHIAIYPSPDFDIDLDDLCMSTAIIMTLVNSKNEFKEHVIKTEKHEIEHQDNQNIMNLHLHENILREQILHHKYLNGIQMHESNASGSTYQWEIVSATLCVGIEHKNSLIHIEGPTLLIPL